MTAAPGVVELAAPVAVGKLCARFADLGCWIRPMGKVIYLTPPFVTSDAELERLTGAIRQVAWETLPTADGVTS